MNHIGDTNKMVSDTPRTDTELEFDPTSVDEVLDWSRQLERELHASNAIIRQQQLLDEENLRLQNRIKRLEEDLMDAKNKHAALVADVALYEDRGERIKRLEEWIACLNPIAQHSGQSENREWHGVDIRWLYPSQVVYLGEAKP